MTSPVRSVNADHVNRLMEAVRIGGGFKMEKLLRVASDIGGYVPETDPRYKPDGRAGASDDIERFEWVARWLGLKDPEAEVLFDLGKPCTRLPVSRGSICWLSWRQSAKVSRWIGISGPGTTRSVLEDLTGRPHVVSIKDEHGKWTDEEEEETSC